MTNEEEEEEQKKNVSTDKEIKKIKKNNEGLISNCKEVITFLRGSNLFTFASFKP